MKNRRPFSQLFQIRNKVLMFGLLMSTLPLIIISVLYFIQMKDNLQQRISQQQHFILESFGRQITDDIDQIIEGLQTLATLSQPKQNQGLFYNLLHRKDSVDEVVIFNQKGIVSKKISRYELNNEIQNAWLSLDQMSTLEKNKQYYGPVTMNKYGEPVMKLAIPIYSGDNRVVGGIGVMIQLKKIIGEISSHRIQNEGYVYLLDGNGQVIAHQNATRLYHPVHSTTEKTLSFQTKIPNLNWTLVMEQPLSQAFAPIYNAFKNGVLVVLFIIALVSLISIYAGLYFTKPIEALQKAMKSIKNGNWSKPVMLNRSDELQDLADAFNDMSEDLKEKTKALLQEKERLDIIVNGIGAGLALVRSNYTVSWMNPILQQWTENYDKTLPCYALFSEHDAPCHDCPMISNNVIHEADDIFTTLSKKGEKKFFRHRVYHLSHGTDNEEEFLIVLEDITEQREMEEKLIQTDKLSALGLMASSFAHEVNNPLATIHVYAEDLVDRLEEESNQLELHEINHYLQVINENTERCKTITTQLLNFSRKTEWNQQLFNINQVIQESITMVQYTFTKSHISLSLQLAHVLPLVWGDKLKLMQVVVNLINNSVDAMEDGGILTITTEHKDHMVTLSIMDTGNGIPKDQLKKVFDPFFTTKPVGKGTGLGLSVCYGIIKQFDGLIDMISEEHKGTTVSIQIPT